MSDLVFDRLTVRLQQHFADTFACRPDATRRFWWVRPLQSVSATAPWLQECLYQQAQHWQPQGEHASQIRQWTNEIQMLLHQLSASDAFADWPDSLNNLWFASVGETPAWRQAGDMVFGRGVLFEGLVASQLPAVTDLPAAAVLEKSNIKRSVMVVDHAEAVDWNALAVAWQAGRLSSLEIIAPFAEVSMHIQCSRWRRWQFWRKPVSPERLFEALVSALPATRQLTPASI